MKTSKIDDILSDLAKDERLLIKRIWSRAYLDTEESHIELIKAYADQQVKSERNKVIDECIRVFDCNEYYYGDIVQSMLESIKIKQP